MISDAVYIKDNNFENSFATKLFRNTSQNHKIVKYIFSKIEEYNYKNDIPFDSDIYTIEHILPESADEKWGGFTNEEINRNVYRLGNMTLLERKLNRDADISNFEVKR
ncbi:MAG: HNH endonuclease [Bacteroidetes bacterium]|nr:HNH endonuclease [Bacteroidota bacterium]